MGSITSRNSGQPSITNNSNDDATDMGNFTWQEMPRLNRFIQDYGWPQQLPPDVLNMLPDHIVVNQKLRDIIEWSLRQYVPRPTPEPENDIRPKTPESLDSFDEQLEVHFEPKVQIIPDQGSSTLVTAPAPVPIQRAMSKKTRPLFFRLRHLRQDIANKIATTKVQPQTKAPTPPVEEIPANGECISCFDEFPASELVHLGCSHDYCKACLREVINNAMKTESAFPPKCCLSEIPLKTILICLEKTEREAYQEKAAEYAIPAGHRWYCPEPKCSKWITPEKLHKNRRTHQTCPHCKIKICSICRSTAHDGNAECPQDFGLNSTLEVAEAEGWRRCYSCRTMVELTTGCRHITCSCGAQFCYVCNAKWRTCSCTETDKLQRLAQLRASKEERQRLERQREAEDARRQQQDAEAAEAAEAEAREIAEAIAQIEEMERQDAIRRAEEEERRQLEEQLALARLEEERLLQEIARREAEEDAERHFRMTLVQSSKEDCQAMAQILSQIIEFQHATLWSQHAQIHDECLDQYDSGQESILAEIQEHRAWMEHNIQLRRKVLQVKHDEAHAVLAQEAEDEEDDLFMQMQQHLRNKPNREQREKKMRDALLLQQKVKKDELDEKHAKDFKHFDTMLQWETDALQKSSELKMSAFRPRKDDDLYKAGRLIGRERRYFEVVSQRRIAMVAAHERKLLRQLDAEEDPTGLEEDDIHDVEPVLPSLDFGIDGADAPEVTPSALTAPFPIYTQSIIEEDSDLYGSSNARSSYAESELERSETVTRAIPGAFPRSSISTASSRNRTSVPQTSALYDHTSAPRFYASPVQHGQPIQPVVQAQEYSYQQSQAQTMSQTQDYSYQAYQQPQSYEHVSRRSVAQDLEIPVTPPEADYASSQAMTTSEASRDSASFDSDNRESNRTSISTKASSNREWAKERDPSKKRTSIFSFKTKPLTPEELKKRYLAAAGDSFGG